MAVEYLKTLEQIAKPLIDAGIYKSSKAFVKDLIRNVARSRIKNYQRIDKKYQAKYGTLEKFSRSRKGKATPKQEDEWMEWESARNMLKAWNRIAKS